MELHSIHATVSSDGTIVLDDLPFAAGDEVSITVVKTGKRDPNNPYPLRGTPYRYDNPFDPVVPPEDWNVLK